MCLYLTVSAAKHAAGCKQRAKHAAGFKQQAKLAYFHCGFVALFCWGIRETRSYVWAHMQALNTKLSAA